MLNWIFQIPETDYRLLILVSGIAINEIAIWGTISISGLAIAALIGVILNKILPRRSTLF